MHTAKDAAAFDEEYRLSDPDTTQSEQNPNPIDSNHAPAGADEDGIEETEDTPAPSKQVDIRVYQNGPIVTIQGFKDEYTGGAHPNQITTSLCLDARTGKTLALEDLFTSDAYDDRLTDGFYTSYKLPKGKPLDQIQGDLQFQVEELPEPAFVLEHDTLFGTYSPYEIAAYGYGTFEFKAYVGDLLKPEYRMVKP